MNNISEICIESISCALPKNHLNILEYAPDLLTEKTANRMAQKTGFESLRITPEYMTTSDLIVAAAEPTLSDVELGDIGAIVFVSQTPDYTLPATSHILQKRLGLSNDVICLDINEGCSGYITGLYTASLLSKQLNKKILLAVGDTISKLTSTKDRATRCIFGDAGTVTIINSGISRGGGNIV